MSEQTHKLKYTLNIKKHDIFYLYLAEQFQA